MSSAANDAANREGGGNTEEERWRPSLGLRLSLWYLSVFIIGLLSLAFLGRFVLERSIEEGERVVVSERLASYTHVVRAGGVPALARSLDAPSEREMRVEIQDEAGERLLERGPPATWFVASAQVNNLRLHVGASQARRDELQRHLGRALFMVLGGALIVGGIGGLFLTRRALAPIRELARVSAAVVESGDLAARVRLARGSGELSEVAGHFNAVLAANERLVRAMREALDNVAHDLRTPLTRLRAGAEVALRDARNDEAVQREALADVVEESDRVLAMLHTMTDVAEAQAGLMRLDVQSIDLASIAHEAADIYELVAAEAGIELHVEATSSVLIEGDRTRLRQAVANLIDNAVKYSSSGTQVRVAVRGEPGTGIIEVRDEGPGIPAAEQPRVWDRLYRGDRSRSQRGLGLGLSLVKAVVDAHGGSAELWSEPGKGALFRLRLPRGGR